jgi:hypothetical protein
MMFLTKNANGGKIPPHKKCQIIKERGKAILISSLWLPINGSQFFASKPNNYGLLRVKEKTA